VSYEDRKSTWNNGVRKTIRRGSAEEKVRKHWRDHVTGVGDKCNQKRRIHVSCDPIMVNGLQEGALMYEEKFKKTRVNEKAKRASIIFSTIHE